MLRKCLALLVAAATLAACGSGADTSGGPSLPNTTVGLADVPPRADVVVAPDIRWTTPLSQQYPDNRHLGVSGKWFTVFAYDPAVPMLMNIAVGEVGTGQVIAELQVPNVSTWPIVGDVNGQPVAFCVQSTGQDREVSAWKVRSGKRLWRKDLGPSDYLNIVGVQGDQLVVAPSAPRHGQWLESQPVVMDTKTGRILWRDVGQSVRQIVVGPKAYLTTFRADGALDGDVDTVELRNRATGAVTARVPWSEVLLGIQGRHTATALENGQWVLLRNDPRPDSAKVAVLAANGSIIWQRSANAIPAIDTAAGVVTVAEVSGELTGRDLATGESVWQIPAATVKQTALSVEFGSDGWFIGETGNQDVVLRSKTGAPAYQGRFQSSTPTRWGQQTYLVWNDQNSVTGVSGPSFPPGVASDSPPDQLIFLRR